MADIFSYLPVPIVTLRTLKSEAKSPEITPQIMYFGMFATIQQSTEEDLKTAEFHGDIHDGLDWS